jgi:lipopolysaccharide/colanic/teichoic acid biosynthesis glycosyltransferase
MFGPSDPLGSAPYPGKGVFDLLAVSLACAVLGPVMLGAAIAAAIEDGGAPLVFERRIGQWRKPFTAVRFRTTSGGCVTRVGRILERTGFSELPQLINVARREMSIVGPRPMSEASARTILLRDERYAARPGMVGLAQLLGGNNLRFGNRLDRLYLRRQNVSLDVWIIAASLAAQVLRKPRARRWLRRLGALPDRLIWPQDLGARLR